MQVVTKWYFGLVEWTLEYMAKGLGFYVSWLSITECIFSLSGPGVGCAKFPGAHADRRGARPPQGHGGCDIWQPRGYLPLPQVKAKAKRKNKAVTSEVKKLPNLSVIYPFLVGIIYPGLLYGVQA